MITVAVGTPVARRPPHRSVRAELPHTAPTSDDWRRSARSDSGCRILALGNPAIDATARTVPTSSGRAGSDAEARGSQRRDHLSPEAVQSCPCCRVLRGS